MYHCQVRLRGPRCCSICRSHCPPGGLSARQATSQQQPALTLLDRHVCRLGPTHALHASANVRRHHFRAVCKSWKGRERTLPLYTPL